MKKSRELVENGGMKALNFFVNTAICCPSRATMLSGKYIHNFAAVNGQCKDFNWGSSGSKCCFFMDLNLDWEKRTLGKLLQDHGYQTALFGKYLNNVDDFCEKSEYRIPMGWDDFNGMCDLKYFGPIFNVNGARKEYPDTEYQTSIIGNLTVNYINEKVNPDKPFFIHVDPHAPHFPATPAPWYANEFDGLKAPRTPNWNTGTERKHWSISVNPPMNNETIEMSDALFRSRWRTVLSVDDMIAAIVEALEKNGQLDNTYIFLSSDHGYNLGTFRLGMHKNQVYDNDLRVPLWILTPHKFPDNTTIPTAMSQVDLFPTILDLAGIQIPKTVDGRSFAPILINPKAPFRNQVLIEYMGHRRRDNKFHQERIYDAWNNTYVGLRILNETHNLLYAEFLPTSCNTDSGPDWNNPYFFELYDISKDPWQMNNIYNEWMQNQPHLVAQMQAELNTQRKCVGKQCF